MKFKIRAGYVIHDVRLVKSGDRLVEQATSYYEGDTADFDETTARAHLHKLEPLDKESNALAKASTAPVTPLPVAGGMDPALLAQLIGQAVAAALPAAVAAIREQEAAATAAAALQAPAQA